MADLKSCEMEVDVNESYVSRVSTDQPAEVELDAYAGVRFPARVRQIVPTADRQKATVQVKVEFAEERSAHPARDGGQGLLPAPGRSGGGRGRPADDGRVLVPKDAVRDRDGRSDRLRGGRRPGRGAAGADRRPGRATGSDPAGLAAGEKVVVSGGDALKDGARVKAGA